MPIFEYRCECCSALFERLRSRSEADQDCRCPACGDPARRIVSAGTLRLERTVAAHRVIDGAAATRERLALPVREHPPRVDPGTPPQVPQRYLRHMFEYGGC